MDPELGRYSEEKILAIEPDLGDQRQSTYKALPSPPRTPKRAMRKLRLSAIIPFALAATSFALTIVFLCGGNGSSVTDDQYMVFINASSVGQGLISFERASSTSSSPSATSSTASTTTNPLDPLNPFSTANPLNPNNPNNPFNPSNTNSPISNLSSIFDPLVNNLTDSVNGGLENAVNEVVGTLVKTAGIADAYYMYAERICEGSLVNGTGGNKNGIKIGECKNYDDAALGLRSLLSNDIQSSIVIGNTNISVPLISQVSHSFGTISSGISVIRKALFAFLIISLIGSGVSTISSFIAILLPEARILVYVALVFSGIEALTSLLAALLLTVLIVGVVSAIDGFGAAVGLYISRGSTALLFIWLRWLFVALASFYWFAIWFVDVRTVSFVKRERGEEEVGNWKRIVKEVRADLKGKREVLDTKGPRKDAEWA